jgi:Tfp pilus assembly protein PilF
MGSETADPQGRRLKTWKEIAAFFGRDERTVKRWETTRGLPVRRVPRGVRSAVYAYEGELRAWLEQDREPDTPDVARDRSGVSFRAVAIAALALLILALGVLVLRSPWRTTADLPAPAARHAANVEAERFYRAGLYGWQSRTPAGLTHAVDDFTQAIVRDPQYAKAYAGLANCYNLLREYTAMPPDYAFPRAKAAAERAIALDPSLPDAHTALAFVDFYWSHDTAAARREFERAIALAPQDATAHHWYATFLMNLRDFRHALAEIDQAQRLDPESSSVLADKGPILFHAGKTDEAMTLLQELEQTAPALSSPHRYLAIINRARGDDANFIRELNLSAERREQSADADIAAAAARGLSQAGHTGMLQAMLSVQRQRFSQLESPDYSLAQTYAGLNDGAQAIGYLKLSLKRHEPDAVSLNIEPDFRALRGLPAFQQLVREAGLEQNPSP